MVENLAVTRDQYDTIDLSGNELRKLDNFPLLLRLKSLLVSNNAISKLQIGEKLPNLEMLVLNENSISEPLALADLTLCKKLLYLSLIDCPIIRRPNYRLEIIQLLPQLRALDFQRITQAERKQASKLTTTDNSSTTSSTKEKDSLSDEERPKKVAKIVDRHKIEEALRNAKSLEEIKQLEKILATGHVPN